VDDHESLMLGAGEIVHKVLPLLSDCSNLSLLLNDIAMAQTAQRFVHGELQLTGGHLIEEGTTLTGPEAERSVTTRSLDLCILEASGLDRDGNLLCVDPGLARVFHAATQSAARTIVVAYQPQLSERDGHVFCNLSEIGGLVIDDGIDPPTMDLLPRKQLELHRRENGIIEFRRTTR
jgi:DeoR/GlpR family transcriptional regulator of sugar metabolism